MSIKATFFQNIFLNYLNNFGKVSFSHHLNDFPFIRNHKILSRHHNNPFFIVLQYLIHFSAQQDLAFFRFLF